MGQPPAVCNFGPFYTQTCSGISFGYVSFPDGNGGFTEESCSVFASCQDGVGGSVQTSCSSLNCFPLGNVVEISAGVMLCQGEQSSSFSLCQQFVRATSLAPSPVWRFSWGGDSCLTFVPVHGFTVRTASRSLSVQRRMLLVDLRQRLLLGGELHKCHHFEAAR